MNFDGTIPAALKPPEAAIPTGISVSVSKDALNHVLFFLPKRDVLSFAITSKYNKILSTSNLANRTISSLTNFRNVLSRTLNQLASKTKNPTEKEKLLMLAEDFNDTIKGVDFKKLNSWINIKASLRDIRKSIIRLLLSLDDTGLKEIMFKINPFINDIYINRTLVYFEHLVEVMANNTTQLLKHDELNITEREYLSEFLPLIDLLPNPVALDFRTRLINIYLIYQDFDLCFLILESFPKDETYDKLIENALSVLGKDIFHKKEENTIRQGRLEKIIDRIVNTDIRTKLLCFSALFYVGFENNEKALSTIDLIPPDAKLVIPESGNRDYGLGKDYIIALILILLLKNGNNSSFLTFYDKLPSGEIKNEINSYIMDSLSLLPEKNELQVNDIREILEKNLLDKSFVHALITRLSLLEL